MKFKVKVLRIAYGETEVEVDADGKMQASIEGITAAKDEEIPTKRSEYEVVGIYKVEEKKKERHFCDECGESVKGDDLLCKRCERMMG
jgi:hypothetical protein